MAETAINQQSSDTVYCNGSAVSVQSGFALPSDLPRTLIRFTGPILPAWRSALAEAGIVTLFWAPPFGAVVRLPDGMKLADLARFEFLAGAIGYSEDLCARPVSPPSEKLLHEVGLLPDMADLVCFSRSDVEAVEALLAARDIPVLARSSVKLRIRFAGDLAEIRAMPGVKIADRARASVLLATAPSAARGADWTSLAIALAADTADPGLDGSGETIAVADTGLDIGADTPGLHPDFAGRLAAIVARPRNDSWNGFLASQQQPLSAADRVSGHGTHVAGLATGSGSRGKGRFRGVAPGARLVFQALEQHCAVAPQYASSIRSGYFLSGRPLDLRELFREAQAAGATIHVNAWGDPAHGAYTDDCYEADLFLVENPDAVLLFAAGNDGADRNGDGRLDPASLFSPASAKNVVAVGATEGPAVGMGLRQSWAGLDPQRKRYLHVGDRAAAVSGIPQRLACFSSAGPTADGRIKPDICAPGTNIVGARSQRAIGVGWGYASPMPWYMYNGGTSTAVGIAGGFTALLRQAWRSQQPSGAALKALMIVAARTVAGRGSFAAALPTEGGFGRLALAGALPGPGVTLFDDRIGLETGETRSFAVAAPSNGRLRAALAWYDVPGERLVNDLDLTLAGAEAHPADRSNTVEVLDVAVAAGPLTLVITGYNVPAGPQPFALAVSIS